MDFLKELNEVVKPLEERIAIDPNPSPSIFIVGVPRSGTTLISQILSSCTEVGYVNNLMARFWMAPAVGARLSAEVLQQRVFTGASNFGQTHFPEEPHEFGAFWRSVLNYVDMTQKRSGNGIDWNELTTTLNRVSSVFGKPVVYKVFQLYWHLAEFFFHMPSSKWIWVRRNETDNALSLLKMRRQKGGNINSWFSALPIGVEHYDTEPAWIQVCAQVRLIENWLTDQFRKVPANSSIQISLDLLCKNPEEQINRMARWLDLETLDGPVQKVINNISEEAFNIEEEQYREKIIQTYLKFEI